MRLLAASCLVLITQTACSVEVPDSSAPSMEQLRNASYGDVLPGLAKLHDGVFEGEPHMPGSASRDYVTLIPEIHAEGDLDGDGVDEAVVGLARNSGGSGLFFSLAVVRNDGGSPKHIATAMLGDRVKVESLRISDGTLYADLVEHGTDDPMCCPTTEVKREWQLESGELVQTVVSKRDKRGRFTGYLVWGHEARSFRNCAEDREGWVVNEAGSELIEIYESLTSQPYQAMFVEVRGEWEDAPTEGFAADYPEALQIMELIRAENEGLGCRRELDGFWYLASGNEPGWQLEIRADGLMMQSINMPDAIEFPSARIISEADQVTVNAGIPDAPVHAVLERKRCVDTMSGARYSFVATVEIDGQQFHGCALQGL